MLQILLPPEQPGLERGDPVEEEEAVEMVHLVLDGHRLEPFRLQFLRSPVSSV